MPELMLTIPLTKLKPSPLNPRKHLGEPAKLAEMANSMKEHGVLEPVIARQAKRGEGYELVCGHRRLAAAKLAELAGIPAIVRRLTDDQVVDIAIIENSHREDVPPLDEAQTFAEAIKRGRTVQTIADSIGRPASFVALRMQLLKLGKLARKALDEGRISLAVAQLVARIPDAKLQDEAIDDIEQDSYDGPVTADAARKLIEERYMLRLGEAPFDVTDAKLVPKAGACSACPKKTGNQAQLFADVKNVDLCTDPECFKSKKVALFQIRLKDAKKGGQEVLEGKAAEKALRGSEFKSLDSHEFVGSKMQTVRALIAKSKPPIVLAMDRDGDVREMVRVADFKKSLPAPARKAEQRESSSDRSYKAAQKQREAKERRRKKAMRLAIAAAVDRAGKLTDAAVLELVVRAFAARAWNEVQKAVLERRGVVIKGYGGHEARLLKLIGEAKTAADVRGFGLELALGTGQLGYGSSGKTFAEGLRLAGVKLETFERQVAAEEKAKAKPQKKKAAAKKATAKKRPAKGKGRAA